MSPRRRLALTLVAVLALLVPLAACSGNDNDDASDPSTTATETTAVAPIETTTPPTDSVAPDETTTVPPDSTPDASDDDTDAFGHTPEQDASYRAAYTAAFEAECRRIWSSYAGGDGLLADPDFAEDTYSVQDCLGELDPDYGSFADSVDEATTSGTDDAQIAASDLADPLCATGGSPCWSYGDS